MPTGGTLRPFALAVHAMPLETTLHYSPDLVRHAVLCFWRRSVGLRTLLVIGAMAAWLGTLVVRGDRSWQMGALGASVAICALVAAMVYVAHYRNAMTRLKDMGATPHATLRADGDSLTLQAGASMATLPWSSIQEIWQFERVWLLLFSRAQFSTLPVADLPADLRDLIETSVRGAGGKVKPTR